MLNFDFLQREPQFAAFAPACLDAERTLAVSPALCALGVRKGAELAVKWLYSADPSLKLPYKDNFAALIFNQSFQEFVDTDIMNCLRYIVRLGNPSAHTAQKVSRREAVLSLANLFEFIRFIFYCYGPSDREAPLFDESLLPAAQDASDAELKKLQSKIETQSEERAALLAEVKNLQAALVATRKENEAKRHFVSDDRSEAETRRSIIDLDMRAMGWQIGRDCLTEYPVVGMPTESGTGFADYVLFGDDGKPLAVVEAKRTTVDPKTGKEQAVLYADCLERMTGRRPLIFYTNGYTTWLWDDLNYPERQVYSIFSKADLERIIARRELIREFRQLNINSDITDRDFQKIAIQRICEDFSRKRRKALLVMATGTGKTRTAVSLVDVLTAHNWIMNVLFLADRRELVKQAKDAFVKFMPNLSCCNLLNRGADEPTDRAIFSTYPTIMNAIDDEQDGGGQRLFSPGHFDLIIIDEAHRSIFKKYRAIFDYFDALLVGLTATPKSEVGHNTYEFFDLQNDMPTFAYEYEQAVAEKHLVDYRCFEKMFSIPNDGVVYDDLSDEEKLAFEEAFDDEDEMPNFISGAEIDRIYFNIDTTRRIISEVMEKGLKVEGGDKLGKTIIFAQNHKHAEFIEAQFNVLYPQYGGKFARVIDSQAAYSQRLLDDFKLSHKYPQIAISVDMLDTGIDVPEILNLVFYKRVFSKVKFWQMIGRGTRLCSDIFGPGEDKKEFCIFDYLGNFRFFEQNPKGFETSETESLAERAFSLKVNLIRELQAGKYQTDELIPFRQSLVDELAATVAGLNREQFMVRAKLQYVEKYSQPEAYQSLGEITANEIISNLASLIPLTGDDEYARRFDVLMFKLELAKAADDEPARRNAEKQVQKIAAKLSEKMTIPDVEAAKATIEKIKGEGFWQTATIPAIDRIREEIRSLLQYLRREFKTKVINLTDAVIFERQGTQLTAENNLDDYYDRAYRYVTENADNPVLWKLKNNVRITGSDFEELKRIFWQEIGTAAEYEQANADGVPLGKFVRSLTGLSETAAHEAFSEFLDTGVFTEAQIHFVKCIMDWIVANGVLEDKYMDDPWLVFGDFDYASAFENDSATFNRIMSVVKSINDNALPLAA